MEFHKQKMEHLTSQTIARQIYDKDDFILSSQAGGWIGKPSKRSRSVGQEGVRVTTSNYFKGKNSWGWNCRRYPICRGNYPKMQLLYV